MNERQDLASDHICIICGDTAHRFYPAGLDDLGSFPYCMDCLKETKAQTLANSEESDLLGVA